MGQASEPHLSGQNAPVGLGRTKPKGNLLIRLVLHWETVAFALGIRELLVDYQGEQVDGGSLTGP